jgi:NitT/TauT family transport system permease protein
MAAPLLVDDPDDDLDRELRGLDALETGEPAPSRVVRLWASAWPKALALGLALAAWQLVVWSGWKEAYILPGPDRVLPRLAEELGRAETWEAILTTMRRAVVGFAVAVVVGTVIGLAVSRWRTLRVGVGSLITGFQTMPSIAWFPLAIVLFQLSEGAIFFVVIIGAAPSIANGVLNGVDNVPPVLVRAGKVMGAGGLMRYRHVTLPAALPAFVAGLKQGWAFSWRSLMAGELLGVIAGSASIGLRLQFEREFADYTGMMAIMLIILVIGILVDAVAFGAAERAILRRRGLAPS